MERSDFLATAAQTLGSQLRTQPPRRRTSDNYVTAHLMRHIHIGVVAAEGSDPEVRVHVRTDNPSLGRIWLRSFVPRLRYRASSKRHYLECSWLANTGDYSNAVPRMADLVSYIVTAGAEGRIPTI